MNGRLKLMTPKFVDYIPTDGDDLVPGTLYITLQHNMVVHRCPCGCGELSEFMLDPIRHRMKYDGENVTFVPSIGNSNLQCRSHYWIQENRVLWCSPMEDWEIELAERREHETALRVRSATSLEKNTHLENLQRWFRKWWKR